MALRRRGRRLPMAFNSNRGRRRILRIKRRPRPIQEGAPHILRQGLTRRILERATAIMVRPALIRFSPRP